MIRLYLDDVRNPPNDGGEPWTICRTAEEARALLLAGTVDDATLDHDLGICSRCTPGEANHEANIVVMVSLDAVCSTGCRCACHETGYDLVKWMAEHGVWPRTKPRVHSANQAGAANMRATIERYWRAPCSA